ncbi:hypothetical protein SO802_019885 [Lithocarpus litseifolius]|uniref:Maturase K n=1 Tax=Lithocarpus litseifolius TaxID=425828 RepID=A0AAW2CRY4_9ROSI
MRLLLTRFEKLQEESFKYAFIMKALNMIPDLGFLRKIHQIEKYIRLLSKLAVSFTSYLKKKRKLILGNKVQKLSQVYPAIKEVLGMTSQRGLSKDFAPMNLSRPWCRFFLSSVVAIV